VASLEPTIAKLQGFAIAGGSDIALSCDLVVTAEDARIGCVPTGCGAARPPRCRCTGWAPSEPNGPQGIGWAGTLRSSSEVVSQQQLF
jgi:hypothetical protein